MPLKHRAAVAGNGFACHAGAGGAGNIRGPVAGAIIDNDDLSNGITWNGIKYKTY